MRGRRKVVAVWLHWLDALLWARSRNGANLYVAVGQIVRAYLMRVLPYE